MLKTIGLCSMLVLGSSLAGAQTPDSVWAGTWTLNTAKSKLHPPVPKSETVVIPAPGWSVHTVRYNATGTAGDGLPINLSFDGAADGKQYPATSNGKEVAKGSFQRQSSRHYTSSFTDSNGGTGTYTSVMAPSGKSFTIQSHFTASTGAVDETQVYDKQ